ncbi:hypothetical protein JYK14_24520 [Siccirubricoccus sp. KC 17139]|uniref:Uncharacterized protein n=1 Tax=Siccirubricoccus soli TaxID=2899147 RepID=A0ABT1DBI4_9PROT|nr:hypothetical protein [Siccirubricoccus soli]MCO6419300.1 hypothetical protein [Siccirubricoccus soli]MCP2685435.1 hypothetical protein [Siccirubricoccus soli]
MAVRVGGRTTKASWAEGFEKGDVRLRGVVRVEANTTTAASFSVTREMARKIEEGACAAGEVPAIAVELLPRDGQPAVRLLVVPDWVPDWVLDGIVGVREESAPRALSCSRCKG